MVRHFVGKFKRKHYRDISGERALMNNLKIKCEVAKKVLSTSPQTGCIL